jgi:hypothetical protein
MLLSKPGVLPMKRMKKRREEEVLRKFLLESLSTKNLITVLWSIHHPEAIAPARPKHAGGEAK